MGTRAFCCGVQMGDILRLSSCSVQYRHFKNSTGVGINRPSRFFEPVIGSLSISRPFRKLLSVSEMTNMKAPRRNWRGWSKGPPRQWKDPAL